MRRIPAALLALLLAAVAVGAVAPAASGAISGSGMTLWSGTGPTRVLQGRSTVLEVNLRSTVSRSARVTVIVRNSGFRQVTRKTWTSVPLSAGTTMSLRHLWATGSAAPGTYKVAVEARTLGGTLLLSTTNAARVEIVAAGTSTGLRTQMLAAINKARSDAGCVGVTSSADLDAAAAAHAQDMKVRRYFSHTSPTGADMVDRILATRYDFRMAGENIARGQTSVAQVMDDWMDSPGHRANILNCSYRNVGIGFVTGPGGPWWVQDFGKL